MPGGTNLAHFIDLQQKPLGTQAGENFKVPVNFRMPSVRVYVINHSRTKEWKRVAVAVSERRGAEDALIYDKKLAEIYNVDTLAKRVEQGRDMNRYEKEAKAVIYGLRIGGKVIPVPPAKSESEAPPRIEVPEGAWDLYLGNFERMHSGDSVVLGEEATRLAMAWRYRHNPVFRVTIDGESKDRDNDFGFLEFVREPVVITTTPLDKEYLTALDLVES